MEIAKTTVVVSGTQTFVVTYGVMAREISASVTSGTLDAAEYFTQACFLTITGAGEVEIIVDGTKIEDNTIIISTPLNDSGEVCNYNNPLITETAVAQAVGVWLGEYLNKRNQYEAAYRGRPEIDVGDLVSGQSDFSDVLSIRILKNVIEYNGALKGTIVYLQDDILD